MPLPFIVPKDFSKTYTVKDETGITLEIPKYGSLTWVEHTTWVEMIRDLSKEPDLSMAAYEGRLCATLLRLRFKLSPETPESEILSTAGGDSLPESMVKAILEFFTKEQSRWKPIPVEDTEKKEPAEK